MKTASLPDSSVAAAPSDAKTGPGVIGRLAAGPQALARLIGRQADVFPAIALAEAGDVDGALELLARSAVNRS
jgi:hypothetical protein